MSGLRDEVRAALANAAGELLELRDSRQFFGKTTRKWLAALCDENEALERLVSMRAPSIRQFHALEAKCAAFEKGMNDNAAELDAMAELATNRLHRAEQAERDRDEWREAYKGTDHTQQQAEWQDERDAMVADKDADRAKIEALEKRQAVLDALLDEKTGIALADDACWVFVDGFGELPIKHGNVATVMERLSSHPKDVEAAYREGYEDAVWVAGMGSGDLDAAWLASTARREAEKAS